MTPLRGISSGAVIVPVVKILNDGSVSWYDNQWGLVCRTADLISSLAVRL
jgi:glyceraldehyde-3-phosphate dehydrogenase/erythrose-4-phosphate dehydrogenase